MWGGVGIGRGLPIDLQVRGYRAGINIGSGGYWDEGCMGPGGVGSRQKRGIGTGVYRAEF